MNEPAGMSGQAPPVRPEAMRETTRRRELSRTRIRINLTWAAAVTLISTVIATAAYVPAFPMQDDWFRSVWPWRAHVWNGYGGDVIWCVNEARRKNQAVVCHIHVERDGPDCDRPETGDVTAAYLCPPWETWPTDPAPRWSAEGPPQWSR